MGIVSGTFTRCDLADDLPSAHCSHPWDSDLRAAGGQASVLARMGQSGDSARDIFDHGSASINTIWR